MNGLRHIPNIISVARILLVIPIVFLMWQGQYGHAFILALIAGLSDGVDGFLARKYGWQSRLGAFLDPIADKLLLLATFLLLGLKGFLPWWLVLLVIFRDVLIVAGAMAYQHVTRDLQIKPLMVSKVNTTMQIILVVFVLFRVANPDIVIAGTWLTGLIWITGLTTFVSGFAYVWHWSRYTIEYSKR
jgi:cardiolipin synthase